MNHFHRYQRIAFVLFLAAGCEGGWDGPGGDGESGNILEANLPIVSISRELPAELVAQRSALVEKKASALMGPESFYLAINRKDLGKRFFLTAFLKVLEPGGVDDGGAASLGTRVVTFRVQNNKLFVFDARDNRATSDAFDPSLILEAYPLVQGFAPFKVLRGSNDYVLFDPAAGLNRFQPFLTDPLERWGDKPAQFKMDLSYMQAFRQIPDGATFEQVFTGTIEDATETFGRDWGTLGIAIRRYSEGQGFEPFAASEDLPPHFFVEEDLRARNTGETFANFSRLNIRRGGKPIQWLISERWSDLNKEFPQYDFVSAVKAGVESWNAAFGFRALEAKMASPADSFAEDDKNYVILDRDPSLDYAYADWRANPNTSEIRGTSVYFSASLIEWGIELFDPSPEMKASRKRPAATKPTSRFRFGWSNLRPVVLCKRGNPDEARRALQPDPDATSLSPKQRVELYVEHIMAHEIGHTLGLRHNFMGSLDPAQSSVMDYVRDEETYRLPKPGSYDVDAVRYLYGLNEKPPEQAFCTDEELEENPLCATWDTSDDPLGKYWAPSFHKAATERLRKWNDERLFFTGTSGFLRAGTEADQARAWEAVSAPVKIGRDVSAAEIVYPGYTKRLSELQDYMLKRLFFDEPEARGDIVKDPVFVGATLTAFTGELESTIRNSDSIRSWAVRRTAVDVLEKMQVQAAYQALLGARDSLITARAGLPGGEEASLTDDLVARIDRAIRPYFDK